jgi:hypothetical protein
LSYSGRNWLIQLLSARQADAMWKLWQARRARARAGLARTIATKWRTDWKSRRAGGSVKIVSIKELKARRAK